MTEQVTDQVTGPGPTPPESPEPARSRGSEAGGATRAGALRRRLRDLQRARADLPPHSAQGWRDDLDDQIDRVQRRLAELRRQD